MFSDIFKIMNDKWQSNQANAVYLLITFEIENVSQHILKKN